MFVYSIFYTYLNNIFFAPFVLLWFFIDNIFPPKVLNYFNSFDSTLTAIQTNTDLTNGLLLIHPVLLYSLIAIYSYILAMWYVSSNLVHKGVNISSNYSKKNIIKISYLLILSIFLGG